MTDSNAENANQEFVTWARQKLDTALTEIGSRGVFKTQDVQARVVWMLPTQILIGQAREQGSKDSFTWIIAGNLPTDHLASTAAATSREAAKRFAMKWQLEAARLQGLLASRKPGSSSGADMEAVCRKLTAQAEGLYEIADQEALWAQFSRPE